MKRLLLFLILVGTTLASFAQNAYIQVKGEAGLSVFLNNQFKGKTTAEYNGIILENVTPGQHLIRVVKTGYVPFEENITIKANEVFAYNVKPFSKHTVTISEKGNSGATGQQAEIETGRLIVQSVPIEIKITIPEIEGGSNNPKTKDEWVADKMPAGNYDISFSFNQKVITKAVVISANTTTNLFVNMMNGEVTIKNSPLVDEEKERLKKEEEERYKKELERLKKEEKEREEERKRMQSYYQNQAGYR